MYTRSERSKQNQRLSNRRYKAARRQRCNELKLCQLCEEPAGDKTRCDKCIAKYRGRYREVGRQKRQKLKEAAFRAYGGNVCGCCKQTFEPWFLQIDHVNNDGNKHKTKSGRRYKGSSLYEWLAKNNYPPGFQVLCANCNFAKGMLGECPHQRQRKEIAEAIECDPLSSLVLT